MDVICNILGGIQSHLARSVISFLLSMSIYCISSIVNYSSENLSSESLSSSYDFIVIGGGSAGTFFHNINRTLHHK